jgi:hypothetical protein
MRVTLLEDGIYGQAGDTVELGMKKAIEMGLVSTKESITTITEETSDEIVEETITEETSDEIVVTTKVKKNRR